MLLERIITAVTVNDGAYVNGTEFNKLYHQTKDCGITINQAFGDKAYFRKHILDTLTGDSVEAIIPVSESVYRIDESRFSYNKDSDQWFCKYFKDAVYFFLKGLRKTLQIEIDD